MVAHGGTLETKRSNNFLNFGNAITFCCVIWIVERNYGTRRIRFSAMLKVLMIFQLKKHRQHSRNVSEIQNLKFKEKVACLRVFRPCAESCCLLVATRLQTCVNVFINLLSLSSSLSVCLWIIVLRIICRSVMRHLFNRWTSWCNVEDSRKGSKRLLLPRKQFFFFE